MALREKAIGFLPGPRLISVRGHHLVADLLDEGSTVVDLGAHLGEFSSEINLRFGCTCYAVEPNPTLWRKIPQTDQIRPFNCAISGTTGPVSFEVSQNLESSRLRDESDPEGGEVIFVQGVTLPDFLNASGVSKIDLLKIDIEGAEFDLFDSLSDEFLVGIKQVTIEFHDFIEALSCGPKVVRTKARLQRLGFALIVFSRRSNSDVLFVNRSAYQGNRLQWFYLERLARQTEGLLRVADRWIARSIGHHDDSVDARRND